MFGIAGSSPSSDVKGILQHLLDQDASVWGSGFEPQRRLVFACDGHVPVIGQRPRRDGHLPVIGQRRFFNDNRAGAQPARICFGANHARLAQSETPQQVCECC